MHWACTIVVVLHVAAGLSGRADPPAGYYAGAEGKHGVALNGKELFAVDDATFAQAGCVGVWTKADSIMLFDAFCYGKAE